MAGPPTKIMLIRHGEKPAKSPGKSGPFDVKLDGTSGGGKMPPLQDRSGRCAALRACALISIAP